MLTHAAEAVDDDEGEGEEELFEDAADDLSLL